MSVRGSASLSSGANAALPLWRQPDFMRLWGAQVSANLGGQASGVAYPLLVLAMTGSPQKASWVVVLHLLPFLILSLPVGAWVDRWDRRRLMLRCVAGRILAVLSLALALAFDRLSLPHLYIVAMLEGVFHVFVNIAGTAALPRVVPPGQLPAATAQNQAGYGASAVAGPALGAALYQGVHRAAPFMLDALCHGWAWWSLWRLRTPMAPVSRQTPRPLRTEVAEGLRWLWRERLVRDMALITSVINAVQAGMPLLLIVLARQQGASEAQVGAVLSCGGGGAVLGALVGPWVQRRVQFGPAVIALLGIEAAVFPLYALGTGPWSLGLVYGAIMFCAPIYNVVQFSHRLAMIPDGLQGRVNSSFRLVAMGLIPVGSAACGWLLEHRGTGTALWVLGSVWAGAALAAVLDPAVRNARRHGDIAPV